MNKRILESGLSLCLCLLLALTLWAPAQAASASEYEAVLEATLENLQATVTDPICDSIGGEWAVLALARGGVEDDAWNGRYLKSLFDTVDECGGVLHTRKYTEYSRVVLALSSLGLDAAALNTGSQVYDLVSPLLSKQTNGEYWASWQGNNGSAFAVIALDSQNYFNNKAGRQVRAALLDSLMKEQLESGAWEISPGDEQPSIDTTAMVLQAIAPYYLDQTRYEKLGASHTYDKLEACVSKALNYLKTVRSNDYGSVEAAAQVVVALAALDRDAAKDATLGNVLGSVLAYYDDDGGFKHLKDGSSGNNQMSTEQACYALVAYDRWKNGKTSLYDMTDRGMASAISITAPGSVSVEQTASGIFRVNSSVPCVAVVQTDAGGYRCLSPEGSGNTRTFHTTRGSVTVVVKGDANGDGVFDGSDITKAKAAYLNKTELDEVHRLAMDIVQDESFEGNDITRAKAAYLGKTSLNW